MAGLLLALSAIQSCELLTTCSTSSPFHACRYEAESGLVKTLAAQATLYDLEQHLMVLRDRGQLATLAARLMPNPLGRVVEQPRPEAREAANGLAGVYFSLGDRSPFRARQV